MLAGQLVDRGMHARARGTLSIGWAPPIAYHGDGLRRGASPVTTHTPAMLDTSELGFRSRLQLHALLHAGPWLAAHFDWRGFGSLSAALGRVFGGAATVVVERANPLMAPQASQPSRAMRLRLRLDDYYWSRLLFAEYRYEPEVAACLAACLRPGTAFIDCGANLGYWSVAARMVLAQSDPVIAVEAAPERYAQLQTNCQLQSQSGRVHTLWHALDDSDEGHAQLDYRARHHAAAALRGRGWLPHPERASAIRVPRISLDHLLDRHLEPRCPTVIKLDIEGSELPVLRTSQGIDSSDVALVYEDHGAQTQLDACVTAYLLEVRGMRVECLQAEGRRPIASRADLRAIERNPELGYNFVAARPASMFWSRLEAHDDQMRQRG